MTAGTPEAQVAGRLVVEVDSSTKGFAQKLKQKIDAAAKGIAAEVGVEIDAPALRKALQSKVDEAAAGVTATIGVDFDAKTLKAKVKAAAKAASTSVKVTADVDGLVKEVTGEVAKAQAAAGPGLLVRLRTWGNLAVEAIKERKKAAAALKAEGPLEVPVTVGGGRRHRLRHILAGGAAAGLLVLIQPIIGVIGQAVAGLTAMAGAADDALGTLAAIPLAVSAGAQAIFGMKVATQGFSDAISLLAEEQQALASGTKLSAERQDELDKQLKELAPSARVAAKAIVGLRDEWVAVRKAVQGAFFRPFAKEIKPLAKVMLPLLRDGLKDTAATLGDLVKQTARWMQTDWFQAKFAQIGRQNNETIKAGGGALLDFAKAFTIFQAAAAPFQKRMDGVIRSFGEWTLETTKANAQDGGIVGFLDRAADKAGQLWNITKQLGGGLGGILKAGTGSGNSLLTQFEDFLTNWNQWVNDDAGQTYLKKWFAAAEPGFVELARLVNDTFKGMAKWAADPKIAGLIKTIRTELGPALGGFLKDLSDDTAQPFLNFLTQLIRLARNLEPAVQPFVAMTKVLTGFADSLNNLAESAPGLTEKIAQIVGALLLLRTMKKLPIPGKTKGGAGGGGLVEGILGGLLGGAAAGGKHSKGVPVAAGATAAGAAAAASGTKAAQGAAGWGKLGGAFSAVAKNPLMKKAGWVGLILSVADMVNTFASAESKSAGFIDALQSITGETSITGIRLQKISDILNKTSAAERAAAESTRKLATAAVNVGVEWMKATARTAAYNKALASLPAAVQTQIKTPGAIESVQDVRDLALLYNLTPKQVQTVMRLEGFSAVQKRIVALGKRYTSLPKDIRTKVETPGAINSLGDVVRLGKQYKLTPKQIRTLMQVTGTDAAGRKVRTLREEIARIKSKMVQMSQKGAEAAKARVAALRAEIRALNGKTVEIKTVRTTEFRTKRSGLNTGRGDALGARGMMLMNNALTFARGGFGDVKNKHQPELAGSGPTRVWREPETKGEAYIPLANDGRRGRAKEILSRVAEMFGGTAFFARGGVESYAKGGTNGGGNAGKNKMKAVGAYVGSGFAAAIKGTFAQVVAGQAALLNKLVAAGKSKAQAEAFLKPYQWRLDAIENLAKRRDAVAAKLAAAQAKIEDLTSSRSELKTGLTESGKNFGSLASIASSAGGFLSPQFLIGELTKRATDAGGFRSILGQLAKNGLGRAGYEQLAGLGFEEGLPIAKQLLGASGAELKKITELQDKIKSAAYHLGVEGSKSYYDSGIQAAQGLVKGLQSQQAALNRAAVSMANVLVAAIRRQLKIKSPSRVAAEDMHRFVDGQIVGLEEWQPRLTKKAQRFAARLAQDLTPTAPGFMSSLSTVPRANTMRYAPAAAMAPLVGELIIQGKSEDEIRDALDQTMFALRKIRQGGVHADRTV